MPLNQDVEALRPLLALADFLQDPAKFGAQLKDLKESLKQYDAMMKVYPTVTEAKRYFAEAEAYVKKANAAIAEQQQKIYAEEIASKKRIAGEDEKLDGRRSELLLLEKEVNARDSSTKEQLLALQGQQSEMRARVEALDARTATLDEVERKQKERAAKVQEALAA